MKTLTFFDNSLIFLITSALPIGSKFAVGSSSIRTFGSWINAAAIAIFCFSPPEYVSMFLFLASKRLKESNNSCAFFLHLFFATLPIVLNK